MAVPALELRPRGSIALFDAAIRLCSRNAGVWALTLPTAGLVFGALLHLTEAVSRGGDLLLPSLMLTGAWMVRGVFQGAACHHLGEHLLGNSEPTAWGSLRAALGRLPSLFITSAYLLFFNLFVGVFTLGFYYLFAGAHLCGYAVTMQGKGHPLSLYGTCSRLLGPARSSAIWVRVCFLVQVLVILNLHIAANALALVGNKLLAIDLTYVERFVSLDNGAWVASIIALGFALFEPLRAAVATLLLIDGRVRQEGLDLISAIEQLPRRRPVKVPTAVAALFLLALVGGPSIARAQGSANLSERLSDVADYCEANPELRQRIEVAGELPQSEQAALSRFVSEVEGYAYDDEDCEYALLRMGHGLPLIVQTRDLLKERGQSLGAKEKAEQILARPEFLPPQEKPPEPEDTEESAFRKWWTRLWEDFFEWLRSNKETRRPTRELSAPGNGSVGFAFANVVVLLLVAAVVVLLVWLVLSGRRKQQAPLGDMESGAVEQTPLSADPMSALSRPPEGWAHLADELAARGEFREAVRSLYLALLSRLHRDGAIDYDPAKSNWDYFRGFKGQREWLSPFRELTLRFDFAYYGNVGVSSEGYQGFRQLIQPMLVPTTRPEAASA